MGLDKQEAVRPTLEFAGKSQVIRAPYLPVGLTCRFKPGVEALYMVFSDQSTEHVYRFPYYDYFKSAIEPLLEQVCCILGKGQGKEGCGGQWRATERGT